MIEKLANSEEGGVGDFPECKRRTVGVKQTEKKRIWEVSHGLQIAGFSFSHRMKRQMTRYW